MVFIKLHSRNARDEVLFNVTGIFFFLLGCRWSAKLLRPIYLKFFLNEIRMFIL